MRILAGIIALPLTVNALLFLGALASGKVDAMIAIFGACSTTVAALCWWFALRGHIAESRARMKITALCGSFLGTIGFAAGFFGPIMLKPEANQGPLLGIFFTGPLGFVAGAAGGWLYARTRGRGPGETAKRRAA